tara:strand:+ start:589 stop:1101 length:513 start_codon:yes stop_codon:yes gene_type:complete
MKIRKIQLRKVKKTDLKDFRNWRNSENIWKNNTQFIFLNMSNQKKWIKSIHDKNSDKHMFTIIDTKKKPIGICGLTNLNPIEKSAKIAIMIGNSNLRSKGIGSQSLELLLNYGFKILKLHRISADVLQYNVKSQSFFEKFNFQKEMELRDYIFRNGKWWNMIVYSKLISD